MNLKSEILRMPFGIKLIYWIVNSIFWISIIGLIVIFIENVLMFAGSNVYSFSKLGIALPLDILTQSTIELNGVILPVEINKISGSINVMDLSLLTKVVYFGSTYFVGSIMIYALSLLKKMIANVKRNDVFTLANVIYLKRASYMFFLSWFMVDVVLRLSKQLLYSPVQSSIRLSTDYLFSTYLIIGAIILAAAHIFERGVEIQNYKNLTI